MLTLSTCQDNIVYHSIVITIDSQIQSPSSVDPFLVVV